MALVPEQLGITLEEALEKSDGLKKAYDSDAEVRELLDLAKQVEGLARNVGTHAAAVVIADKPLIEYVPLQHVQGKEEIITQWAMADVERAGLLKMDFLGLRNLTILSKVVRLIQRDDGARRSTLTRSRSTTSRRSICFAGARRRASSNWKAAASATSCSG